MQFAYRMQHQMLQFAAIKKKGRGGWIHTHLPRQWIKGTESGFSRTSCICTGTELAGSQMIPMGPITPHSNQKTAGKLFRPPTPQVVKNDVLKQIIFLINILLYLSPACKIHIEHHFSFSSHFQKSAFTLSVM